MMYWIILCCTSFFCFTAVHSLSCVSTPTQVYSRLNTNAVLPFDISADLKPSSSTTFNIRFYDETLVALVRYQSNGDINPQAIPGYTFTANAAGKGELTIQNVEDNKKGIYYIGGGGTSFRCTCLYILGVPTKATVSVSNNPAVGGSATLTCRSTSTTSPSNHGLTFMYNWKVDNADNPTESRYSYSSNRNTLTLSQLVKDDVNKQFTCTAKEHVINGYTSSSSDSVTLDIHYGPENISFTPSAISYERNENTDLGPITCTANCNPPCSFRWNKDGQNPAKSNNAKLNLHALSSTDAGVYRCTATRSGASTAVKDLAVSVIYGPRNMIFTPAGISYIYNENFDPPSISCGSDCYMCNYSWTGPNSYTHSGQVLDLGSLQRSMDGQYRCTATNSKLSSQNTLSKQVKIEVRYGPDSVSITPSDSSYTVDEETTLPNIRCKADCFPVCTYRWTKEGQSGAVSNTDTLPLGTVKKNFAGKYTCTATNGEFPKTLNTHVVINVRYGPYASSTTLSPSTQEYIQNEDGQVLPDIRCSADCYPNCTYSWTKTKQGEITTVSTTSVLSLGSLKRLDAAKYTCIATNPGKLNSTTKHVDVKVRYGPDDATIRVQSPYTVTEGEQATDIICSSDCYPRCTYRWTNSTSDAPIGTNGVLSLQTVNRYMAGTYKCTSSNAAAEYSKDSDSTLDVIVKYAPDVNLRFSHTNVSEGSNLTLYCNGAGVPTTNTYTSLTQTLNGIQIPNRNTAASGTQEHSSIYFPSLHWHDTGTYTCTVNNGVKDITGVLPQTGSVDLYVKVQPKVLDDDLRFTGVTGGTVIIQLPIYSLPVTDKVEITRYDGQPISTNAEKYNISSLDTNVHTNFYDAPVSLNGKNISFIIFNLEEKDFGNYTLTMKNEIGVTDVYVFVIAEGPPSIPKGLYFLSDDKSLTFIWEKNFNGGQKQTFIIQTSVAESNNWKNRTEVYEDDTVHRVNETFYTASVRLDPGVYKARIFSHNDKGHSEFVELGYTFKVVKEEDDTTQKLPIGGIVGGIGAAGGVFGIAAVVLFTIKRRQRNKDGSTTKLKSSSSHGVDDDDDDDEDEVNTVNPMYVSADEVPPTDNTYAQPIKKKKVVAEQGDLYAMVDKKPKSQPKDGDIYENAPEVAKKDKKKKTSKGKGKAYEENPYEDPGTTTNNKPRRNVNKDGLIYADLTFNDQPKGHNKLVIHGLDSMTEYVEVDFSKKADPLPDSDEENCESKN